MGVSGFLKQVIEIKQEEIERSRQRISLQTIRGDAEQTDTPASFLTALSASAPDHIGIIAEVKKASPSKGDIRPDLDCVQFAENYTEAGARAISVLTESRFFKGSLMDLETVCRHTGLPVLRKDFTLSSYQIYEAKRAGASSILLIVTLLSRDQLTDYIHLVRELGMEPLVEINSEKELETACTCDARVIGINNRNLETLETDLDVSKRISPLIPGTIVRVEASGISSRKDIDQGVKSGFYNFLVGESIVRADDTKGFIQSLIHPHT
ncbi:MAG: indole-3-glycerol phosphate synthase TrpC [Desulfobacteraceae bacterium]|nr:MAG: indole-3-glycerol phosphate synthase TrpC [Desulfobacteraceae bacterium]